MESLQKVKGKFITFEGPEGAGKSTQSKLLVEYLNNHNIEAVWTREPGGCPEAEEIRQILINGSANKLDGITELLLMYSARRLHTEKKIKPLLAKGITVISDRYLDSTMAYQGFGHQLPLENITALKKIVLDNFEPDLTIILDINILEGLDRTEKRGDRNRFEEMELDFHRRVRAGFKEIAETNIHRCKLLEVQNLSKEDIQSKIITTINQFFS